MCFQFNFFVFLLSRPWFKLNLLAGLTCNPIGSNAFFHSQFAFNGNPRFLFIFEPFQYVWMWSLVGLTSMGPPPCEVNHVSPSLQSWRRDKQLSWYQGYIFSRVYFFNEWMQAVQQYKGQLDMLSRFHFQAKLECAQRMKNCRMHRRVNHVAPFTMAGDCCLLSQGCIFKQNWKSPQTISHSNHVLC